MDLPQDPLKIADRSSLIEFGRGEVGLLMTASSEGTPLLLPPEGPAGYFLTNRLRRNCDCTNVHDTLLFLDKSDVSLLSQLKHEPAIIQP